MRRSVPSSTELRIAAGLRRRDPDAVRALYAEYGPGALALLHDAIRDRAAVEDVYQQVLLEAWQRGRSFDPARASLRTWLATIARSRAIDHLRRRVPEPHDPTDGYAIRDPGGTCEPVTQLVDRVTLEQLLERLTPDEAAVVRLRWQLGLSQSQIATHTGVPLGTVKSRTASALRRLRAMLEEERPLRCGALAAGALPPQAFAKCSAFLPT
jgi:RNA polymerase sigma-70 factor, ECF subfamily